VDVADKNDRHDCGFRAGLDDVAAASPEFHENALMGTR
jgi:hypothetical protein